jgi:hypothetical protein
MKIKINQKLFNVDGLTPISADGKELTLKDVCINAMLTPVAPTYSEQGTMTKKGDDDKTKYEKWDMFKKLRDAKEDVELKSEEITFLKKWIGEFQPQLIYGQCYDLLEK